MKLIITAPAHAMDRYLEQVVADVEAGCTSGHWDSETYWETEEEKAVTEAGIQHDGY